MSGLREPVADRAPVYVISRDGEPERLVALWAEADRLGVELHRIAATDAADGDDAALIRASDHRRAWARIAAGEATHAVVIEDGAALDDRLAPLLDLGRLAREVPDHGVVNLDGGRPGEGEPRIVRPGTAPQRCGAYVVARGAARALLDSPRRAEPLERALARRAEHGVEVCVAEPAPVVAPDAEDTVGTTWLTRLGTLLRPRERSRPSVASMVPPLRPSPAHD